MKEKEVDMWLSIASGVQLMFIGSGGAYFMEFVKQTPSFVVKYFGMLGLILTCILLIIIYTKISNIIKRKDL